MPKKQLIKKLNTPNGINYQRKSINELILASMYLAAGKEKLSFERLVKECFTRFQIVFSFSQYPQWPDARKLDRPLRELREKKLISGNPASWFCLTKAGEKIAREIIKEFAQKKLNL